MKRSQFYIAAMATMFCFFAGAAQEPSTPKYPTVTMSKKFVAKDKKNGVIYCRGVETVGDPTDLCGKAVIPVFPKEGQLFSAQGELIPDSKNGKDGIINYVMDADGHFYLFDEFTHPKIRHSSIFAGGPVAGAGNIVIRDGTVECIDSDSGHYATRVLFANVLKELQLAGITAGLCGP